MKLEEFKASVAHQEPPTDLSVPLVALWWDMKGDWTQAHSLVDELETKDGMAVHAYLHRKEGQAANSDYWYQRAGRESTGQLSRTSGRRWLQRCYPPLNRPGALSLRRNAVYRVRRWWSARRRLHAA